MRGREPAFLRWLALAALADWLVTRTLARAAIFMPKAPPVLVVYRALILGGQVGSVLAALLALLVMGWLAWHFWQAHKVPLSLILLGLAIFSLISLAIPPGGLIQLIVHLLNLAAILWIGLEAWRRASSITSRIAVMLPALALFFGGLYQASQILYAAFSLPGSPRFALGLFNLGELFVVLAPMGMWWAYRFHTYDSSTVVQSAWPGGIWWGRGVTSPLLAAIPAIGYSAFTLANPSMAGILAIWSTGLTLYLPWPLYALSLWLFGVTFLALRRLKHPVAWALLLLAAGGYAPQLSSQAFFGLIGLSLFAMGPSQVGSTAADVRELIFSPDSVKVS